MLEVELKARIADKEIVQGLLAARYDYVRRFLKEDSYYYVRKKGRKKGIRIRKDGSKTCITFKTKRKNAGIEINQEHEYSVSGSDAAEKLLLYLGCKFDYKKRKEGVLYRDSNTGLSMELCDVGNLGCFLELEYLLDSGNDKQIEEKQIEQARAGLMSVLKSLGISEAAIEPRFYSELIKMTEL